MNAVPSQAPDAPAASTAASPRPVVIPPAASTGTLTASRTACEKRQRGQEVRAVSAALAASSDEDLDADLLGLLGRRDVVDLGGGRDPGIAYPVGPSLGRTKADRDQVGAGGDRGVKQLRFALDGPGQKADPEPHAGASRDSGLPLDQLDRAGTPDPDHPETPGRGDSGGEPATRRAAHRRAHDRNGKPELCRPLRQKSRGAAHPHRCITAAQLTA